MTTMLAVVCVARGWEAAVVDGSGAPLAQASGDDAAAALVPALHGLLDAHQVQALAVVEGPGSFMGLRIAVGAVRTIAYTDRLPIHAVDACAALAAAAGPGRWAVLLPLKRDTTFTAVVVVAADGTITMERAVRAVLDDDDADLASCGASALGPALVDKPALVRRWLPDAPWGSAAGVSAVAVAGAARHVPARPWAGLLPRYHQLSGPELLRQGKTAGE